MSHPVNLIYEGIILANTDDINDVDEAHSHTDPLDALHVSMEANDDMNLYLHLNNIEDIEMSMDSTKRKRCEDGEETTSQAT